MECGILVRCIITDGSQPVGWGIGPVQEAQDVLAVLKGDGQVPADLRERSILLAANLIDLAENCGMGEAERKAVMLLESGAAWTQFQLIAAAQGGFKELPSAQYAHQCLSSQSGKIRSIDNRRLARLAKLAGAPLDKAAGIRLHVKVGSTVRQDEPLFTLFSASQGELEYAMDYHRENPDIFAF